jgi:hypothetical protein
MELEAKISSCSESDAEVAGVETMQGFQGSVCWWNASASHSYLCLSTSLREGKLPEHGCVLNLVATNKQLTLHAANALLQLPLGLLLLHELTAAMGQRCDGS